MKKSIYLAAAVVCLPTFAQNQTQPASPQTPPPATTSPSTPASATERLSQGLRNLVADHRLEDLPQAVQKTIREHSGGAKIADIDRETRTGRVLWEVEFEKEGKNTEIHVAEDGTLVQDAGIVARTTTRVGESSTAVGTPAAGQSGRSAISIGTKWEDLPPAIQQKAMQFGGKEKVADIDRETEDGRVEYEIEFSREGRNLEIEFAEDGTITESSDPSVAPVGSSGSTSATGAGRLPSTQPAQSTQPGQQSQPGQPRTQVPPPAQQPPASTQPQP